VNKAGDPDGVILLGYDIRDSLDDQTCAEWSQERRSQYLIRPEVRWPVSVDRIVWPSPIEENMNGFPLNLWSSIAEAVEALRETAPHRSSAGSNTPAVIEISVVPDPQSARYWENLVEGFAQPGTDDTLEHTIESFGYDVADRYLLSGLSNCGLCAVEIDVVRKRFAPEINAFGLFGDPVAAADFRMSCDQLNQEHAPFCVYRVRRIKPSREA
jgi:hypothetical protein